MSAKLVVTVGIGSGGVCRAATGEALAMTTAVYSYWACVVAMPLRVTMIFRREVEGWKVVHRHADPITTARSITSTFVS